MLDSPVLDVGLGLALIYLLLSLIMTSVRESFEGIFKTRAANLEQALAELLDDPKSSALRKAFYEHPMIASLYRGSYSSGVFAAEKRIGAAARNLPSYIPREQFALALTDLLSPTDSEDEATPSAKAKRAYALAVRVSGGDLARTRKELESWYDGAMDRTAGWYRRQTQVFLFFAGLAVAVLLNVNSLVIAQTLATDDAMRAHLAAIAEAQREDLKPAATPPASPTIEPTESTAVVTAAPQVSPPAAGAQPEATGAWEPSDQNAAIQKAQESFRAIGLPIGWDQVAVDRIAHDFTDANLLQWLLSAIKLIAGYLITALAVMLGAPFWFDVLNKIMVIRSTVKPKEKSPDEASEDRTTKKTKGEGERADSQTADPPTTATTPEVDGPVPDRTPPPGPDIVVYG